MLNPELVSYLYQKARLNTSPRKNFLTLPRFIYRALYRLIVKTKDPLMRIKVGDKYLYMNASHKLPHVKYYYPHYDTSLPRICQFIQEKQGYLTLIDVGANIGDTVSLITDKVSGKFLCIEPDSRYFQLLVTNTQAIPGVICENVLLDEAEESSNLLLVKAGGTARLEIASQASQEPCLMTTTVDKLIEKHPDFIKANILKIDTDGYDYKVLRGSHDFLAKSQPIIFFELLPWYLKATGENPNSIFPYLAQLGYSQGLFYDNIGYPVLKIDIRSSETISQLLHYASIKNNLYYDVLLFPSNCDQELQYFYEQELKLFPPAKWS